MVNETISALKLFNEKAEKLRSLSFAKNIEGSRFRLYGVKGGGIRVERKGPQGESIDAFILTYRFFIQDNESSSFRNLSEYYKDSTIPTKIRDKFNRARDELNQFLDKDSFINCNEEQLTYRKIQDIFIYGGYAHAKPDKKRIFDSWMGFVPLNAMLENEFVFVVGTILKFIFHIKEINEEAISILE